MNDIQLHQLEAGGLMVTYFDGERTHVYTSVTEFLADGWDLKGGN